MKPTQKHFEIFKKECLYWQDRFELHNWDLHFRWSNDKRKRASCTASISGYIATISLSKDWDNYKKITEQDIKMTSKHEMIHVLLGRLSSLITATFLSSNEVEEANEEIVRKLEWIIK